MTKFHFPKGRARELLDGMDQEHLQKLLERAQFVDKSDLARKLDTDSDLVSHVIVLCFRLLRFWDISAQTVHRTFSQAGASTLCGACGQLL
jgi:hypothetical protein